jgi:class 3 adenylate cyclase
VDEGGTLQALKAIRAELIDPTIASHNGRLVKTTGDGFLVEFGSVVDALHCSTEVQAEMAERMQLCLRISASTRPRSGRGGILPPAGHNRTSGGTFRRDFDIGDHDC